MMQSSRFFCLVFIRFSSNRVHILHKIFKIEESLVLDLMILMYRNTDEIEKLKKIKEGSDREMAMMLQQLKTLSESRDSMQQELKELKDAA